ncbi:MAG TPA: CbiX/SirB N-terminal domain-containing protein [Anaerolineae bacterium]|nr:CbiX/SirB N-terminal domain-containing protein [Anaerolineae bacterium]
MTTIVLAMHGAPPTDVSPQEVAQLMGLHASLERVAGAEREALRRRYDALDAAMRARPRSAENDPFWAASHTLGQALARATECEVIVGFNEFCAPRLDEALDRAAGQAERVVVVTPMMTRGGEHAEIEIPAEVEAARRRHHGVEFTYAWPFDVDDVARFLAGQIEGCL